MFKIFVIFYIALPSNCSRSGSTLAQSTMLDWKSTALPCGFPWGWKNQCLFSPYHFYVTVFSLWKLYPQYVLELHTVPVRTFSFTILEPCNHQFWKHFGFPWYTILSFTFTFSLYGSPWCQMFYSVSWESLSTLFFLFVFWISKNYFLFWLFSILFYFINKILTHS